MNAPRYIVLCFSSLVVLQWAMVTGWAAPPVPVANFTVETIQLSFASPEPMVLWEKKAALCDAKPEDKRVACWLGQLTQIAQVVQRKYRWGVSRLHPTYRWAMSQACSGKESRVIERLICYSNASQVFNQELDTVSQALRVGDPSRVWQQLIEKKHIIPIVVGKFCEDKARNLCDIKVAIRTLRAEMGQVATTFLAAANAGIEFSYLVRRCDRLQQEGACTLARPWVDTLLGAGNADAIAYKPMKPPAPKTVPVETTEPAPDPTENPENEKPILESPTQGEDETTGETADQDATDTAPPADLSMGLRRLLPPEIEDATDAEGKCPVDVTKEGREAKNSDNPVEVLRGQAIEYACRVLRLFPNDPSARFLAEFGLNSADLSRSIAEASLLERLSFIPAVTERYLPWIEASLQKLADLPAAGPVDDVKVAVQDLRQYLQGELKTLKDQLNDLGQSPWKFKSISEKIQAGPFLTRFRPGNPLREKFCAWKRALETQSRGITQKFPRGLMTCTLGELPVETTP